MNYKFHILLFFSLSKIGYGSFSLPKYNEYKLDNGLTIYTVQKKDVPLISYNMGIKCGAIYDKQLKGLNSITFGSLSNGSKKYTKQQIREEAEFLGSSINVISGKEISFVSSKFFSKDFDKINDIIQSMVLTPTFKEVEFNKLKKLQSQKLAQQFESPKSVIGTFFEKQIFGDHSYSNPVSGTVEGLKKIKNSNVKKYYNECVSPERTVITLVGDIESSKILNIIKNTFGKWKNNKSKNKLEVGPVKYHTDKSVLLINKSDARESTFYWGGKGIPRNHEDFTQLRLINTILGARFTSWLNDELRIKSGLTYGARSKFQPYINGGYFAISTYTANRNTEKTLEKALEVYKKLKKGVIEKDVLESAKNYVLGQFPPSLESSSQIAQFLTLMKFTGIDKNDIANFEKNIAAVDQARAKELIEKYFPKLENLNLVIIGKASEIEKIVKKYGPVKVIEMNSKTL